MPYFPLTLPCKAVFDRFAKQIRRADFAAASESR
jgi:hypothetical protein